MPSGAISGVGTQFKKSDMASSPTFSAIAEVKGVSGPTMSRKTITVTNFDSAGGYEEFITGFRDAGEVNFTFNYTRDGYLAMKEDFETETAKDYQIILPDTGSTTLDFSGLVTSLPLDVPLEDAITCNTTIKISGSVTVSS
jgi:predicted secreted protein